MSDAAGHAGPPRWVQRGSAPMARAIAGKRWFPLWAVVHHRGRPRIVDGAEAAAFAKPFFRPIVARFPAAILLTRQ